jgi:hypothetical protein
MRGKARSAAAPVASRKNGLRGIFMVMPQSLSIFPGTISIISNADLNVRFWHLADIARPSNGDEALTAIAKQDPISS